MICALYDVYMYIYKVNTDYYYYYLSVCPSIPATMMNRSEARGVGP